MEKIFIPPMDTELMGRLQCTREGDELKLLMVFPYKYIILTQYMLIA